MNYFVSYTTRDKEVTKSSLLSFSEKLKKFGSVFIDIIDNNSENKQARVISELENSDMLILIESPETYKSEWVSIEIEKAKELRIPIKTISVIDLYTLTEFEMSKRFS